MGQQSLRGFPGPEITWMDNGFNRGLLSFRHLEIFCHTLESIRNAQLWLIGYLHTFDELSLVII